MNSNEIYLKEVCNGFNNNKGRAFVYSYPPFKGEEVITNVIYLYRNKHPDNQILIVFDNFASRLKQSECLRRFNISEDNIKMFSKDYINKNKIYSNDLIILYNIFDIDLLDKFIKSSHFILAIFTKNILNNEFTNFINNSLPEIITSIKNTNIINDKLNSEILEYRIGVDMDEEDIKSYKKYDDYIKQSISIFGNFDNIEKCRIGDIKNNISAGDFRRKLAEDNGWRADLDTTSNFNKQIDDIYNPNSLYERASIVYNLCRDRGNLLLNNKNKLNAIKDIIEKNKNKKILIISKNGEFANLICSYINDNNIGSCGCYHDCIESNYMQDENGNTIVYKTGKDKGKPKPFGTIALSNYFLDLFNRNIINILSCKNNISDKIKLSVDLVIFTSSTLIPIDEIIAKCNNIEFTNPIITYKIFCNNTIEYNKIISQIPKKNIKIFEEEKNITIDNESGDIIL